MKKIFITILTAAIAFVATSCDALLNPRQIDLIYNEVFWESQTDAEVGLSGVYALYRGLMASGRNWYSRADATTGFVRSGWNGGSPRGLYTVGNYTDITVDEKMWGSPGLESYCDWSSFYKVVAQANLVIAKVEAMDDKVFDTGVKDRILGEAYFLRALVYFNILRIWGNAPYISDSIESSSQVINKDLTPILIPRTEDIEIAANVIADAAVAVSNLKFGTPGDSRWGIFANKGAAEALYAEANMWMWFLCKRDRIPGVMKYIEEAIKALEDLRDNGGYSYAIYTPDGVRNMYLGQSTEAIFECNISVDQNESYRADQGGITALTCKMDSFDGDPTKDRGTQIDWVPFNQKKNLYPEYDFETGTGDIRPNLFFAAWDSEYNDAVNDVPGNSANDRTKITWMKKYAQFSEDTYRKQDEYVAYFAECNIPVFRYTGEMLLLAEAYYRNDEAGKALAIVNAIRTRAGLETFTGGEEDLYYEILQETFSEMFGEGQIYFTMVRNNYFPNEHLMPALKYKQKGYYWPVSSSILSMNTMIDQTPYWNGKTKW